MFASEIGAAVAGGVGMTGRGGGASSEQARLASARKRNGLYLRYKAKLLRRPSFSG
jgi:hypothetical protein